jgi:hypothetical protein
MWRTRVDEKAVAEIANDPNLVPDLRREADRILSRARPKAPSWLDAQWSVRAGNRSRDGQAFAQAVARGSGTVLAEYGGRTSPAYAYFRSSLR